MSLNRDLFFFQDSYFLFSLRGIQGIPMGSILKAAVADGLMTFVWVFFASTAGACTSVVATYFGVQADLYANLLITAFIIVLHIFIFDIVADILGGASFSLAGTLSFYAAGVGDDDLLSMAFRLPAQVYDFNGISFSFFFFFLSSAEFVMCCGKFIFRRRLEQSVVCLRFWSICLKSTITCWMDLR